RGGCAGCAQPLNDLPAARRGPRPGQINPHRCAESSMRYSVVVTAVIATAATAMVSGAPSGASAADKLKVGFVYLGPVGDFGWTYQHEIGRQGLVKSVGDQIETTYLENVPEGPDAERAVEQLVRSGHKLIFTTSFGYMDPTLKV